MCTVLLVVSNTCEQYCCVCTLRNIYVCTYTYRYAHIYIYIYICLFICIYLFIFIYTDTHTHTLRVEAITIILENPFDTSDPNCIDVFQLQLGHVETIGFRV